MLQVVTSQRRAAQRILAKLPAAKVQTAADFLKFLDIAEELEATREITSNRTAFKRIQRSRNAWSAGRRRQFIEWKPSR